MRSNRGRRLSAAILFSLPLLLVAACGGTRESSPPPTAAGVGEHSPGSVPGLVVYHSNYDAATTAIKLGDSLRAAGGSVVAGPEPGSYSRTPGQPVPVETVVIGQMPHDDVSLVQAQQQAAVNLPQKYLIWATNDNTVDVAFNSADYLAQTVNADPSAAQRVAATSARVVAAATGTQQPISTGPQPSAGNFLTTVASTTDVPTTVSRLESAAAQANLPSPTEVDQARLAKSAGITVPPATVVFVDNPAVAAPIAQANPWAAIDLPARFLVWQNKQGQTMISYLNADYLAARFSLPQASAPVAALRNEMKKFANAAASPDA